MQRRNCLHLRGASTLSLQMSKDFLWNFKPIGNCEIADTKKRVHRASTHWGTDARIWRSVSLVIVIARWWSIFMWGKCLLWCTHTYIHTKSAVEIKFWKWEEPPFWKNLQMILLRAHLRRYHCFNPPLPDVKTTHGFWILKTDTATRCASLKTLEVVYNPSPW